MLSNIVKGFHCDPDDVKAVKTTGEGTCALFLSGQSPVDGGFTLDYDADEVAKAVNEACDELYATEDRDSDDEKEEDEDS